MIVQTTIYLDEETKAILDRQPRSFNFSEFVRQQIKEVLAHSS